jgi:hypothetical protein
MWRVFAGVTLTILCTGVGAVGYAQPDIKVDKFCSTVTVNGVAGQIWRITENGIATWVILDANRQYLADAPARCIEILGEMLRRQEPQVAPSIQPIPATSEPTPIPIAPSGTGARDEK